MRKEKIIKHALERLKKLPEDKVKEVDDYIHFLWNKYHEEYRLQKGIESIVEESDSFQFLEDEEELYSTKDLKEKYK